MPANVLTSRDTMESTRLLSPNENKGRKGKWGGRFMKRIFRRDDKKHNKSKNQQQAVPNAESECGEESIADRYFATLKDTSVSSGIEELDHTTVNLSYSAGSNPYSTDESYEADVRANWRRKKVVNLKSKSTSATGASATQNGEKYRNSDISSNSDPTATSASFHNTSASYGNTENSFVQLDVPKMQRISSSYNGRVVRKSVTDDYDDTSFVSEAGIFDNDNEIPFVFHTRSSTSRVLEDTCPTIGSSAIVADHGMEVVLFDNGSAGIDLDLADDNEVDDEIFMSFKLPAANNEEYDEWLDPFKTDGMKTVFPEIKQMASSTIKENVASTPQRKFSIEFDRGEEVGNLHNNVPASPAVSLRSETSVTWVSHDDDGADERPMKEICVPNVDCDGTLEAADTLPPVDDIYYDHDSINEVAIKNIISESLLTPQSSNNTIFASTPVVDEKQAEGNAFASAAASFPFFWNSPNNVTSVRSAFTPQSTPAVVSTQSQYRLSPRRVQSSADAANVAIAHFDHSVETSGCNNEGRIVSSPQFPAASIQQKTPSSAFLKRKSVFMGEDLLSQEAESFAEFLEDRKELILLEKPQNLTTVSPISGAKILPSSTSKHSIRHSSLSAADRLLIAMTESVDNSETDDTDDRCKEDELVPVLPVISSVVSEGHADAVLNTSSKFISSLNDIENTISESVDMSYPGTATLQSLATSRTGSTDIFSKSLSDEDADDEEEELTNNASASYASSCTSYAPSTLQGSRSSGVKFTRSRTSSTGVKQLPYCGVFIREDIGGDDEEEYEEDDMSLPSEDFSVHRDSTNIRQNISSMSSLRNSRRRSDSNANADGTPLLDQVRNELLETVQDLAREGSSVVMKFLRQQS